MSRTGLKNEKGLFALQECLFCKAKKPISQCEKHGLRIGLTMPDVSRAGAGHERNAHNQLLKYGYAHNTGKYAQ